MSAMLAAGLMLELQPNFSTRVDEARPGLKRGRALSGPKRRLRQSNEMSEVCSEADIAQTSRM
jgi:hypothetical protein